MQLHHDVLKSMQRWQLYFQDKMTWWFPDSGRSGWGSLGYSSQVQVNISDYVCMCHDGLSVGSGFCEVHKMTAGAGVQVVAGVIVIMQLTFGLAGKGVDVVGASSLMMGASGPTASG